MRRLVFWASAFGVVYTYLLFPLLVAARARLRPRPVQQDDITPLLSIVLAAHNEADAIGARLENLLGCDYPAERREIVVASDGSTDSTEAIVASYADRRVTLLGLPRVGKATALNEAVARATGEILVFTDANTAFATDALRELVRPFADPEVGGVAGDQRYLPRGGDASATGERRYWDLDRRIKALESRAGSTVSATGAIYAIRRELFEPVRTGVTDDFYTSTAVVAAGRRLVFAERAAAFEPPAESTGLEFGRKTRIITRGLRGVAARRALLDPRRHGFYSLQLLSHKVLRRVVVLPLLALLASALLLWPAGAFYRLAALAQVGGYAVGTVGLLFRDRPWARRKPIALPSFFILVNAAALKAIVDLARGRRIDRWQPRRNAGTADGVDRTDGTGGADGAGGQVGLDASSGSVGPGRAGDPGEPHP